MCTIPQALEVAAQLDPWLAAHLADVFEKVGTLDPHDEIVQTYVAYAQLALLLSNHARSNLSYGISIRDHFVLAYAEHLHSDPSLFEIELEYMGRCGVLGRERIGAVIGHISVVQPPVSTEFTCVYFMSFVPFIPFLQSSGTDIPILQRQTQPPPTNPSHGSNRWV